ncbi:MAG: ATP-binding cassette domain-containing protein [Bacteroidales bacterium]|nr:ATP-binding cassette domain-containing protein [Bacteroidales bacterium]
MIEARHLQKTFGDHHVLNDISCTFEAGKTNLIIGQSGSGKTVLMKSLVGLHDIDSGEIEYDGRLFSSMTIKDKRLIRHEIGMLFQGGALFDSMNVRDNIMFPLNMLTEQTIEEKMERVDFCLQRVNLENAHLLMPSELSGGMTKRVAIARAIALNPNYLFCDEPNSGLDPRTAGLIDELIQEITQEYHITTIINTHDMNSVLNIGDTISFIYQGKLWWKGTKEEVMTTDNQELNDFVFSMELTKRLKNSRV